MKSTLLLIWLVFFGQLSAQIVFNKTYSCQYTSGEDFETEAKIIQTSDGGYIIAGSTISSGKAPTLVKLNQNGDTLWTRKGIPHTSALELIRMIATSDNGILLNYSSSLSSILIKTDSTGNVMWSKTYGTMQSRIYLGNIIEKADGSFVTSGLLDSIIQTLAIFHLSSTGTMLGIKLIDNWHNGLNMVPTSDDGYIMAGHHGFDCVMIKLDANENITWTQVYSLSNTSPFFRKGFVWETSDQGFVFGGGMLTTSENIYLMKTDSLGNLTWNYSYPIANMSIIGGCPTAADGATLFFSDGYSIGQSFGINSSGNVTWVRQYDQNMPLAAIAPTFDGGYVADFAGMEGFRVIKTDSLGATSCNDYSWTQNQSSLVWTATPGLSTTSFRTCSTTSVNEVFTGHLPYLTDICATYNSVINLNENTGIQLYPNPVSENLTIEFNMGIHFLGTRLLMFDCLGNKTREENIIQQKTTIPKNDLAPGIYFWQITNETGSVGSGKIIVQE